VDDWLGRLETLELAPFELDPTVGFFPSGLALRVESAAGVQGGRLGGVMDGGHAFQRAEEEVVGLVPDWVAELITLPQQSFLSLELQTLDEVEQVRLSLRHGTRRLDYRRDEVGLWHLGEDETEAQELTPVLDPLLFLRAEAYLPAESELNESIAVVFTDLGGQEHSFEVGLAIREGEPRAAISVGGSKSLASTRTLHQSLLALFPR
jgi:hypothetical protein